tara:strand:- start:824 stop:2392 length:1569 start_codon:yes stop_codon:yes gene_type:complete
MTSLLYDKNIEEIETLINDHLHINQKNKVSQGEVFTPMWLILEMLETLPNKVWQNPQLTWLDPGAGIGNFSMVVFYKLDIGLQKWEKNAIKRRKHILENMIHMVELTSSNVDIAEKIFGTHANISNSDFLSDTNKWQTEFNQKKFDIILGNPPYNKNGMRGKGRSDVGLSVIWNKFVEMSITLMHANGHCLFFTPNSWTELKSSLSDKMLETQIIVFKNFDVVTAYKIFDKKAGSLPLCYYLLENKDPYTTTLVHDSIIDEFVPFDLYKHMFIPNKNIRLVKKVLEKTNGNLEDNYHFTPPKIKKDTTTYFSNYTQSHPYPLVNYVHKKIYVSFSKNYSRMQNRRPKLILPNYSMGYPILDEDGIMDVGGRSSYAIFVEDDNINKLKKIQEFCFTNLAFTLINSLKTAQKFMSTRTFTLFPDVTKINVPMNDKSLEKYFDMNEIERESIQQQMKHGEGNVTQEKKDEVFNFTLRDYISNDNIQFIKKKIDNAKKSDKKTFRTIKKRRRKKRSRKLRSRKNKE